MKRMTNVWLALAMILVLVVATACGAADTPTPAPVPTDTPMAAAVATDTPMMAAVATDTPMAAPPTAMMGGTMAKVTGNLTVWHSYGSGGTAEGTALGKALDQFKKDNPDATLTVLDVPFDQLFNKFETESAAGGGPDLFIAPNDSLGKEARANLLLALDDKLAGKLDNDLPVAVDGSKVGGKLYAVPESLKAVAMFYNKDKVQTPPATTDDLMAAVKAGTKVGINQSQYHNWGFWAAFGGKIYDDAGACAATQSGVADALTYLKALKEAGAQFFTDGNKFDEAFQNGTIDVAIEGPWKTGDFKKALGDKLAVAPMPAGPKGPGMPLTGVDGWYINANSKNADAAVNFALYMTSPLIEQIFVTDAGHIPADKTIAITDSITQGFAQAVASGFPRPQIAELDNYWTPFGDAVNKVMDGGVDPKQAVTDACSAMDKANKKTPGGATTDMTPTPGMSGSAMGGTMAKVTGNLTVWHSYGSGGTAEGTALGKALDQFKKDNPDATLTVLDVPFDQLFNKFETESAAGGGPDLFIAPNDSLGKEARANLLLALDDKLAGKLDNDLPVAVDGSKVGGKLYAVPESLKAVAMFYNKDKVQTPPATTDDLMAAVKAGTKVGINQSQYHNWGFWAAFGGKIYDDTGKCAATQGGVADALTYLKALKEAGAQFFTDGNKFDEAFQNGTIDVAIEGPWKTGDFKKALGDKLAVAPMPAGPKGPSMPLTGVDGWYINANSKNADAAVNFALYMTSPLIEQIFVTDAGHIPADKTIAITDPITKGFAQAVASGFPRPQIPELDNYWTPFGDAVNKVMDGGVDPKQAVTDACSAMDKANKK